MPFNAPAACALADSSRSRPTFSVVKGPSGKPELEAYYPVSAGKPSYLLRVSLDPALVPRILMALAPADGLSAVVNTRGLFITRTMAWPKSLGTPATIYL